MLNDRDDTQSFGAIVFIGWERLLLAGALLAGFLAILAVSGTALLVRMAGGNPGRASPFVAVGPT